MPNLTTPYQGYPLPHPDNLLQQDVVNLATAISAIDTDVNRLTQEANNTDTSQMRSLMSMMPIEIPNTKADNRRSFGIFAVYDHSGETQLVRPAYRSGTTDVESAKIEYLTLAPNGFQTPVHETYYVRNNDHENTPTNIIYALGSSAILPLAKSTSATDIAYDIVHSCQNSVSDDVLNYGGIFTHTGGFSTIIKPKQGIDATDQWGISTEYNHNAHLARILYDNQKHCLVMVDDATSKLIEKYRDLDVNTQINIQTNAEFQAYVDAGDFTTVCFIQNSIADLYGYSRQNQSEVIMSNYQYHYFGYFGVINGQVKMGGDRYNAHYRFTEALTLEPVNYIFANQVIPNVKSTTYGIETGDGEVTIALVDMQGETLSTYHLRLTSDVSGALAGYIASAVNCINPYSHTGIINESKNGKKYGIGRTCRAF